MSKTEPVSKLELKPLQDLDDDLKERLQKTKERVGFVPNVLLAYSFDNTKLRAFLDMANDLMLGDSELSRLEREMIATAVSAVNHCHYCLTAHGAAVRVRSGDPELGELIVQNYRAAELEPRQKAMLDFAVKLTERPDMIEDEDRQKLRDAGFSEREIWDIAAVAGFYNMSNRIATAAEIRPNAEYHYMVREREDPRP